MTVDHEYFAAVFANVNSIGHNGFDRVKKADHYFFNKF